MLTESITLRDGFQVWNGDSTLDGSDPATDLLLNVGPLVAGAPKAFLSHAVALAKLGEMLVKEQFGSLVVHPKVLGAPPKLAAEMVRKETDAHTAKVAKRMFTAKGESRTTVFRDRAKLALTASLDVPASEHNDEGDPEAPCICDSHPATRKLYLSREFGQPLYSEHEWDLLSAAFDKYNALPKWEKENWLTINGPLQRAMNDYLALVTVAKTVESSCRSDRHYFGLETEQALSGSPEIAVPATVAREGVEHPKWGTMHGVIETERDTVTEDGEIVPVVTFHKTHLGVNEAHVAQATGYEEREFFWHRAPVVAGFGWDHERGFLTDPALSLSDQNRSRLLSGIRAESERRRIHGDVWHSPKRPIIHKRRKDGTEYTTQGQSRFYQMQQSKRAWAARRKRELVQALVQAIGHEINDPRVIARIEALGYDGTLRALQNLCAEREIDIPEAHTLVLV